MHPIWDFREGMKAGKDNLALAPYQLGPSTAMSLFPLNFYVARRAMSKSISQNNKSGSGDQVTGLKTYRQRPS